jgi:hypothetical protein
MSISTPPLHRLVLPKEIGIHPSNDCVFVQILNILAAFNNFQLMLLGQHLMA